VKSRFPERNRCLSGQPANKKTEIRQPDKLARLEIEMENGEAGVLLRDNQAYVALQPLDPDALRSRIEEDFRVKRWRSIVGRSILRERFARLDDRMTRRAGGSLL